MGSAMSYNYPTWGMSWLGSWGDSWGPIAVHDDTIWGGHQPMPFSRRRKTDDDEILDVVAMLLPFLDKLNSARGLT